MLVHEISRFPGLPLRFDPEPVPMQVPVPSYRGSGTWEPACWQFLGTCGNLPGTGNLCLCMLQHQHQLLGWFVRASTNSPVRNPRRGPSPPRSSPRPPAGLACRPRPESRIIET